MATSTLFAAFSSITITDFKQSHHTQIPYSSVDVTKSYSKIPRTPSKTTHPLSHTIVQHLKFSPGKELTRKNGELATQRELVNFSRNLDENNDRHSDLTHTQIPGVNCGINTNSDRILNGQSSEISDFPWQVYLRSCQCLSANDCTYHNNKCAECGGSLLSDKWILTAAHCVDFSVSGSNLYMQNPTYAVVGSSDKTDNGEITTYDPPDFIPDITYKNVLWYDEVHFHEDWGSLKSDPLTRSSVLTFGVDIAVIKFTPDLSSWNLDTYNSMPVCLPEPGLCLEGGDGGITQGDFFKVSGWGLVADAQELLNQDECFNAWSGHGFNTWVNNLVCAKGANSTISGTCEGDSGGPLVYNRKGIVYQYGIVSFGPSNCDDTDMPSGFTRLTSFLDWVKDKTGIVNENSIDAKKLPNLNSEDSIYYDYVDETCTDRTLDFGGATRNHSLVLDTIIGSYTNREIASQQAQRASSIQKTVQNGFDAVELISKIGCWCGYLEDQIDVQNYFSQDFSVTDEYDQLCKNLVSCESESFLNTSSVCSVENPDSNVLFRFSFEPQTMQYQCKADFSCAFDLCQCQLEWAIKVFQIFGGDLEVESDFIGMDSESCEVRTTFTPGFPETTENFITSENLETTQVLATTENSVTSEDFVSTVVPITTENTVTIENTATTENTITTENTKTTENNIATGDTVSTSSNSFLTSTIELTSATVETTMFFQTTNQPETSDTTNPETVYTATTDNPLTTSIYSTQDLSTTSEPPLETPEFNSTHHISSTADLVQLLFSLKRNGTIDSSEYLVLKNPPDTFITPPIITSGQVLNNGCYCPKLFFPTQTGYNPKPVNNYDKICDYNKRCSRCASKQNLCKITNFYAVEIDDDEISCESFFNDDCMSDKCECDLKTAEDLYRLAIEERAVVQPVIDDGVCENRQHLTDESGRNSACCGVVPFFLLWSPESPGLECRLQGSAGYPVIYDVLQDSVVRGF